MPDKSKFTIVALTGGLGNQLFQLSAGMSHAFNTNTLLGLELKLGSPRKSNDAGVELMDFKSSSEKFYDFSTGSSLLPSKFFNYLLTGGLRIKDEKQNLLFRSIRALSEDLLSLRFRRKVHLAISNNLGYSEIEQADNLFLIGYFQSYKFFESQNVKKAMQRLTTIDSENDSQISRLAEDEEPLVVHIRRGDYRKEKQFGLLSKDFYRSAINEQFRKFPYGKIWLFSDELEFAKTLIPRSFESRVRVMPPVRSSSAHTLDIMKQGKGFVLANSSFGYWAAQLSGVSPERVIAPNPWFKDIVEPKDLVNPKWERIDATWEE